MEFHLNTSSAEQISVHLNACDTLFVPKLSSYVTIETYAEKLFDKAVRIEYFEENELLALLAFYVNLDAGFCFITNVSVDKKLKGKKIGDLLLLRLVNYCLENNIKQIQLEVRKENIKAINFYKKHSFVLLKENIDNFELQKNNIVMKRNYNEELKDTSDHKYAYNFDFDVMHHFMLKSFMPFFKEGNFLELGSFKGDFTRKFLPYFDDVTCVEASDEAIEIAKNEFGSNVKFVNSLFETATLPTKYENIVLTHVLEHIDDPVAVLKRINDEWLSDNGRFFLVCPNANAPSRQIAVKMGLISHNSAVTPSEKEHGHHITYTLDTLERDAKAAGLKVVHRSGIFFKALANFQWDRLLQTDIISKEYLDGCYELGQQYPDLCSSIFLMCEKGE